MNLAPNGKPSNLTPEQYRLVRTPAFKAWFGDWENSPETASKVVDSNGEPLLVWHGTPTKPSESNNRYVRSEGILEGDKPYPIFWEFDESFYGITDSGWVGAGIYFTPDKSFAYEFGDRLIPCFIRMINPFYFKDDNSNAKGNIYRFLKSIQHLKGLPINFKLNYQLPNPKKNIDYKGDEYTLSYRVDKYFDKKRNKDIYYIIQSYDDTNGGIVDVTSDDEMLGIAYLNDKKNNNEHNGFISSIISDIGNSIFSNILKENGHDGVIQLDVNSEYESNERSGSAKILLPKDEIYKPSEIVVYSNKNIKLADGTNTTFDSNNPDIRFELGGLYHGSPNNFCNNGFDTNKVGSSFSKGAMGWGIYFTSEKDIADRYSKIPSEEQGISYDEAIKLMVIGKNVIGKRIISRDGDKDDSHKALILIYPKDVNELRDKNSFFGDIKWFKNIDYPNVYKVTLHKGKSSLEYDYAESILTKRQILKIKIQAKKENLDLNIDNPNDYLYIVYNYLSEKLGGERSASLFLLRAGIDGIKYPCIYTDLIDEEKMDNCYNYVVFDSENIIIDECINPDIRYAEGGLANIKKLYRGTNTEEHDTRRFTWFSENKDFAKGFGDILIDKEINVGRVFDSTNEKQVQLLIDNNFNLYNEYDDTYFETAKEASNYSDTWDFIENSVGVINFIDSIGYDSIKILEGGSNVNYILIKKYAEGGSIPDLLSSQEVEDKLGRELHWWNDDIVYLSGIKYKKVYLRPEYKKVIE